MQNMPICYLFMGFVMEMLLLRAENAVYGFIIAKYQIQECLLVLTTNCMRLVHFPAVILLLNVQTNKMWMKWKAFFSRQNIVRQQTHEEFLHVSVFHI